MFKMRKNDLKKNVRAEHYDRNEKIIDNCQFRKKGKELRDQNISLHPTEKWTVVFYA